ncbi:MAG TPA: hypothetical protein VK663_01115 [Burkholderiales bacterium]|nr:hypothetical protein [Burkholderiales bacterium]
MPLNPNIILGVQPPQIQQQDPLSNYAKVIGIQSAQQQGQLQGLQYDQAKQGMADESAIRSATIQSGGDSAVLRKLLQQQGAYKQLQALDKFDLENKSKQSEIAKNTSTANKNDIDTAFKKAEHLGAIFDYAKDKPDAWPGVRALVVQINPEADAKLPQQFDPNYIQAKIAEGQTITERLKAAQAAQNNATTIRGQDMTAATAKEGQGVTMRGQDIGAQTAREGHGVTMRGQNMVDARSRQTLDQGKWQNDLARGIQVNTATGESRPITANGAPIEAKNDAPEAMLKAAGYADRMSKASGLLDKFSADGKPGIVESAAGRSPIAANLSRSPERQQYHQAQEDWVRAKLRQESGAVIADEEMAREIRTYFPQIGDKPGVIAQKEQARKVAENAMRTASGRAKSAIPSEAAPKSGIKFLGFQ